MNYQIFLPENFHFFLVVKSSVYLNRRVFVMRTFSVLGSCSCYRRNRSQSFCISERRSLLPRHQYIHVQNLFEFFFFFFFIVVFVLILDLHYTYAGQQKSLLFTSGVYKFVTKVQLQH